MHNFSLASNKIQPAKLGCFFVVCKFLTKEAAFEFISFDKFLLMISGHIKIKT